MTGLKSWSRFENVHDGQDPQAKSACLTLPLPVLSVVAVNHCCCEEPLADLDLSTLRLRRPGSVSTLSGSAASDQQEPH